MCNQQLRMQRKKFSKFLFRENGGENEGRITKNDWAFFYYFLLCNSFFLLATDTLEDAIKVCEMTMQDSFANIDIC